jgi:hypothetical protein
VRKLVFGPIPDDYSPIRHLVISPASFVGREEIFTKFEDLSYITIYQSKSELTALDEKTRNESLFLVSGLAKQLYPDQYEEHSYRFWKTILYPFLGLVVPWLYRKQLLFQKILEKYEGEDFETTLIEDAIRFQFQDEFQLMIDGLWNAEVNAWVWSRLIEQKAPGSWKINYRPSHHKLEPALRERFKKKSGLKATIRNSYYALIYRWHGIYGFNNWHNLGIQFLLNLKPRIIVPHQTQLPPEGSSIDWIFDVGYVINKMIPDSLRNLNFETKGVRRKIKAGKIVNYSNRLYYDIGSKLMAAMAYENNGIVISTQHGGHNYGSASTFEYGDQIEYHSDYFISWGWMKPGRNLLPLPSPLLSNYFNTHHRRNSRLILVGTKTNCYVTRFDSAVNDVDIIQYRRNKITFINNIDSKDLWYRPYPPNSISLLDWEYVSSNSLQKVNQLDGDLHVEMQRCDLLILDHPGATWNIAMAMNTPTVCFWEPTHFPFNAEAEGFLKRFRKLGMYFENPQAAAQKVKQIMKDYNNDASEWWNQPEIQELRLAWMEKYARTDAKWLSNWLTALWKMGT